MKKIMFPMKWLGLIWLLSGWVSFASASVVANFDYGNSTAYADAFAGKVGSGWLSVWTVGTVQATSPSGTVLALGDSGFSELASGSGNYLKISYTSKGASTASAVSYGRQYGGGTGSVIDLTQSVQYAFSVRADSTGENVQIAEATGIIAGSGDTCTWYITGTGGYWNLIVGSKDGKGTNYSTGVAFSANTTYSFIVTANPTTKTYAVQIYDGLGGLLFDTATTQITQLQNPGFRSSAATLGGYINFIDQDANIANSETLSLSIDSIAISQIPEPQTWVMLICGVAVLFAASSKKIRAFSRV